VRTVLPIRIHPCDHAHLSQPGKAFHCFPKILASLDRGTEDVLDKLPHQNGNGTNESSSGLNELDEGLADSLNRLDSLDKLFTNVTPVESRHDDRTNEDLVGATQHNSNRLLITV
jgi:hypothetical protein